MTTDKSAKERHELNQKILRVERKEDDFNRLKNQYEKELIQFQDKFQNLSQQIERLYEDDLAYSQIRQKLERNQELSSWVGNYVDNQLEAISSVGRQVRNNLDEKRENLIKERNSLPWE